MKIHLLLIHIFLIIYVIGWWWNGLVPFTFGYDTLTLRILCRFVLWLFDLGLISILASLDTVNFGLIFVFIPLSSLFVLFVVLSSLHHICEINLQLFLSFVLWPWIWRHLSLFGTIIRSLAQDLTLVIVLIELVNSGGVELLDARRLN